MPNMILLSVLSLSNGLHTFHTVTNKKRYVIKREGERGGGEGGRGRTEVVGRDYWCRA